MHLRRLSKLKMTSDRIDINGAAVSIIAWIFYMLVIGGKPKRSEYIETIKQVYRNFRKVIYFSISDEAINAAGTEISNMRIG